MNIEQKIEKYCELKQIPIRNGKIPRRYAKEIWVFIQENEKSEKAHKIYNEYMDEVGFDPKKLIGDKNKFDPDRRMSKQDWKTMGG